MVTDKSSTSQSSSVVAVTCTNCNVTYAPNASSPLTHTACPICGNRQPYGWHKPQVPRPLSVDRTPTPIRDATKQECAQVLAQLEWQAYNTPHVADGRFPRDITLLGSQAIPFVYVTATRHWERRWLDSASRPYSAQFLPAQCTPISSIDPWTCEFAPRTTAGDKEYSDSRELPETFYVTPCQDCDGTAKRECSQCVGTGTHVCEVCRGSKKASCRNCNGTGTVVTYFTTHETVSCYECQGRGYFRDLTGMGELAKRSGQRLSNTCTRCSGRGQINELMRHPTTETCTLCCGLRTVQCTDCNEQGFAQCKQCSATGNVPCGNCDGKGKFLNYVEVKRKCWTKVEHSGILWPADRFEDGVIRQQITDYLQPKRDTCDTSKWPLIVDWLAPPATIKRSSSEAWIGTPCEAFICDHIARCDAPEPDGARVRLLGITARHTLAVGVSYMWNEQAYTHWDIAHYPVGQESVYTIRNRTPLFDAAVSIAEEALKCWTMGKGDEAATKLRFCIDIAKRDKRMEEYLTTVNIPGDLKSAADKKMWVVFGAATARRAKDGATAAVKSVSAWVGGLLKKSAGEK
jgi:hypothetical protein